MTFDVDTQRQTAPPFDSRVLTQDDGLIAESTLNFTVTVLYCSAVFQVTLVPVASSYLRPAQFLVLRNFVGTAVAALDLARSCMYWEGRYVPVLILRAVHA